MNTAISINIIIEMCSIFISLTFIVCLIITGQTKRYVERCFIVGVISNIIVMLSNVIMLYFNGHTGNTVKIIMEIGSFISLNSGYFLVFVLAWYLGCIFKERDNKSSNIPLKLTAGIMFFAFIFTVISQFNHMYYIIGKNNFYIRQSWYPLSLALGIVGLIINTVFIVKHNTMFSRKEFILLCIFILLPIAGMIIQMFTFGPVLYISITLSILIAYVGIQERFYSRIILNEAKLERSRSEIIISQIQPHFLYNALTTIVENALKYSRYTEGILEIVLATCDDNENFYISVLYNNKDDNINPMNDVKKRLDVMCKGNISVRKLDNGKIEVRVAIPKNISI